jgi:hypothetical protein
MNPREKSFAMDESPRGSVRSSSGRASPGGQRVFWLALLLAILSGGMTLAQQTVPGGNRQASNRPFGTTQPPIDQTLAGGFANPLYQQRRLRQLNEAQHKAMVSDTDKLLKLVTELNRVIDGSRPAALTPDQLRMVADIEKLAHSVKDKMRTAVSPPDVPQHGPLPSLPLRQF